MRRDVKKPNDGEAERQRVQDEVERQRVSQQGEVNHQRGQDSEVERQRVLLKLCEVVGGEQPKLVQS